MFKSLVLAALLGFSGLAFANGGITMSGDFFGKDMAYVKLHGDKEFVQNINSDDLFIGINDCLAYNDALRLLVVNRAQELEEKGFRPSRLLIAQSNPQSAHISSLNITFEYKNSQGLIVTDSFEAGLNWNPDGASIQPVSDLVMGDL